MSRLWVRFLLPLVLILATVAYATGPLVERLTMAWFRRDLDIRAQVIGASLEASLAGDDAAGKERVEGIFNRVTRDERLYGVALCDERGRVLYASTLFPAEADCRAEPAQQASAQGKLLELPNGPFHVATRDFETESRRPRRIVLVHDMSFATRRSSDSRHYFILVFVGIGLVVALLTMIVAQLSFRGWIEGLRSMIRRRSLLDLDGFRATPELRPVLREFRRALRQLEEEQRSRDESRVEWTPASIRDVLREEFSGEQVLVVSNREPYIHERRDGGIEVRKPASGLVSALEPVMRACSGTWIAHGSGSADREVVDADDRIAVPPEKATYQLRRVWLTPEEEEGYYYGFSNEGLWPLCHIAHTRPIFRSADWERYVQANRRFADAVVEEARRDDPVVLVQDYHFALLPKMIRERLPNATILTFWHIPWPNAESFGICPWRQEILDGLLGSTIMGFHTPHHVNNFLETVDRYMESRIDRESNVVSLQGNLTAVRHYPISIEWPPRLMDTIPGVRECAAEFRRRHGIGAGVRIGIGVDRLDYTKGIEERLWAIERLFELYPEWIGHFTFVQIAAPTRAKIDSYRNFGEDVTRLADRINARFGREGYVPIVLLKQHHEPPEVYRGFRAADLCLVTSLHDGMNLVAKEFIAARDDEQGVLILSLFAGASRELPEALLVNPYDFDQCARALHAALSMSPEERRARMRSLRAVVRDFNVFRWAGRMVLDAAMVRRRSRVLKHVRNWDFLERLPVAP